MFSLVSPRFASNLDIYNTCLQKYNKKKIHRICRQSPRTEKYRIEGGEFRVIFTYCFYYCFPLCRTKRIRFSQQTLG